MTSPHTKDVNMMQTCKLALLTAVLLGANVSVLPAGDWPMFGRDATRNAVSPEAGPPVTWDVELSHDHSAYCAPIFGNGVLYVATNRRLYAIRDEQNGARAGRTAPDKIRLAAPASRSADRLRPPRSLTKPN
jgi:hypothetical protein